ncbi:MAG: nuclear transport factor 2 family protein [Tannerellaceae bacterium]|jgi:ketosteroid isomerase-like protein|nr:nuclear transport factor 2 family protein [Tannerellaceae bacterium]
MENKSKEKEIISLEKSALEEWNRGNPSEYLKIYSKDITYFDPFQEKRLDGLDAVEKLYERLRGNISVEKYEMLNPVVEICQDMAVLSYNLISCSGHDVYRWNCTEVYRMEADNQWKIIHNHWSLVNTQ